MNIAVFIKQVPADGSVKTGTDHTLQRDSAAKMINPADLNALEEGLSIRDEIGGSVTVLSMGPASTESMLLQTAAMGADQLYLINDPAFAGADTYATAKTLGRAVEILGGFDLLICGRRSIDGETGQVGPELAALLDIPCMTNCVSLKVGDNAIFCRRMLEKEYQEWQLSLPALVTVYYGINAPRLASIRGLRRIKNMEVKKLTAEDLKLSAEECGLKGSPTRVVHVTARPFGKRSPQRFDLKTGISPALTLIQQAQGKETKNAQ
jgi:electron transfer flavoprotein beta subunit